MTRYSVGADPSLAPGSAMFVPGFGEGPDCPLPITFLEMAAKLDVTPHVPLLVDQDEQYTIIPPLEQQVENPTLQKGLDADLIVGFSAGGILLHQALADRTVRSDQRLVLINPSVRNPNDFMKKMGRTGRDISAEEAAMVAWDGGAARVLPGATRHDRQIIVREGYQEEIDCEGFTPPLFGAQLLSKFAVHGINRARILKVEHDARLGRNHDALMEEMRTQLAPGVEVGVTTLPGCSHFLTKQEREVMEDILSGEVFDRPPDEIWARKGVKEYAH